MERSLLCGRRRGNDATKSNFVFEGQAARLRQNRRRNRGGRTGEKGHKVMQFLSGGVTWGMWWMAK